MPPGEVRIVLVLRLGKSFFSSVFFPAQSFCSYVYQANHKISVGRIEFRRTSVFDGMAEAIGRERRIVFDAYPAAHQPAIYEIRQSGHGSKCAADSKLADP